jgi:hypothetical protein
MTILDSPQTGERLQVTIREAAHLLSFDTSMVRRMIKRRELDAG